MDQILIKDLLVRTVIGIDEHERSHLWDVLINLLIFTDFSRPGRSDDINDCVNYATVVQQVQALVERAARHTLEALAEDIAQFCLEIPGVNGVKVRVEKPNAVHFTRLVGVEIERYAVFKPVAAKDAEDGLSTTTPDSARPAGLREWKIRPAGVGDIPALVELRLGMFQSMGYSDPAELERLRKESYEYMIHKLPSGEYMSWVADVNGQAVASGALVIHSAPPTIRNRRGLEGYVMSVFSAPEWRKQGIARAIMTAILDYLRMKSIPAVTLRATEQGRSLYLSLGFMPDDRTMALDIK
jgi:FolB domain-containing protein